jgi:hypothetical protein
MQKVYNKSTKRFSFISNRNTTAKKAGSNVVTITANPISEGYATGQASLTLTVREAQALQSFLSKPGVLG